MGSFPKDIDYQYNPGSVGSHGEGSLFGDFAAATSTASASNLWPSANLAIYIPFEVRTYVTALLIAWRNGVAVSGNFDVGIFDEAGNKLVSSGSQAQATISVSQSYDITDTVLAPGTYFAGMAFDNGTATVFQTPVSGSAGARTACGIQQQATAFPLPSSATFANYTTSTTVPVIAIMTDFTSI